MERIVEKAVPPIFLMLGILTLINGSWPWWGSVALIAVSAVGVMCEVVQLVNRLAKVAEGCSTIAEFVRKIK